MALWSTAYQNSLPNSSFLWVSDDGKERKLPYKDANGKIDMPHVANAKARLNQTQGIPADEKAKILKKINDILGKQNNTMFRVTKIELDAQGNLPTRLMVMQSGSWPNSMKGDFEITPEDLAQVKTNFDNKVGFPTEDASTGLAIDFKHDYDDQAAGWIKGLELDNTDSKVTKLWADPVEWTDAGATAIQSGQFKCISPSGWFGRKNGKLSAWPDPQNVKNKIANVLDGAGLTNIPFLRGMSPIRAHAQDDDLQLDYDSIIFSKDDSQKNKGESMTIDEIRVKAKDQLSEEEVKFLDEHKSELSADELKKFELTVEDPADPKDQLSAEDKELLAAIKSGTKVVVDKTQTTAEAERLTALEATAKKYETEKATSVIEAHIKRGAIKQDSSDFWVNSLLSATGQDRTDLEAQLKALPDNELLKTELGSAEDINAGSTAREQLDVLAKKMVDDAAKKGETIVYGDALKQVYSQHKDLKTQDSQEQKTKAGALNAVGA